jgi:hypothetical protein
MGKRRAVFCNFNLGAFGVIAKIIKHLLKVLIGRGPVQQSGPHEQSAHLCIECAQDVESPF